MEPALDPMAQTALRSMKDISVPAPVSWLPQTWGWLLLSVILLAAALLWAMVAVRRFRHNAYRREAIEALEKITPRLRSQATRQAAVQDIALLMKRVSLAAFGRSHVGRLSGDEWARFLESHARKGQDGMLLGKLVDDIEYHDAAGIEERSADLGENLVVEARRWIESHHV